MLISSSPNQRHAIVQLQVSQYIWTFPSSTLYITPYQGTFVMSMLENMFIKDQKIRKTTFTLTVMEMGKLTHMFFVSGDVEDNLTLGQECIVPVFMLLWILCGLTKPLGIIKVCQHWFRQWFVAWWHQAITWNSIGIIISEVLWHSPENNFTWNAQDSN